jgi:hypothetical protein
MRVLSLLFSFVVTALLATVALTYLSHRVGENRIVVQDSWLGDSAEPVAYRAYGNVAADH